MAQSISTVSRFSMWENTCQSQASSLPPMLDLNTDPRQQDNGSYSVYCVSYFLFSSLRSLYIFHAVSCSMSAIKSKCQQPSLKSSKQKRLKVYKIGVLKKVFWKNPVCVNSTGLIQRYINIIVYYSLSFPSCLFPQHMEDNYESRKKRTSRGLLFWINDRGKENGGTLMLIGKFWYFVDGMKRLHFPLPQLIQPKEVMAPPFLSMNKLKKRDGHTLPKFMQLNLSTRILRPECLSVFVKWALSKAWRGEQGLNGPQECQSARIPPGNKLLSKCALMQHQSIKESER